MMSCECAARENWPGAAFRRGCGCSRCRAGRIEDLARNSLSAALAHSQSRAEAGGWGNELTIDRDVSVIWGPRVNLANWLTNPVVRAGAGSPTRPGQWLYKLFLRGDAKPLYLGRVTQQRTLARRIRDHVTAGTPLKGLTGAGVWPLITLNKTRLRQRPRDPLALNESALIDNIIASLGPAAFQISVAEVRRLAPRTGRPGRAFAADTALAEKHYHRRNASRINSRHNDRAERDPTLSRLVDRVTIFATRGKPLWRMP